MKLPRLFGLFSPRSGLTFFLFKMSDKTPEATESVASKKRKNPAPDSDSKPKKSKVNLANVKNKLRRQELFKNQKHEKNKEKRERRKKQRKDEDWEKVPNHTWTICRVRRHVYCRDIFILKCFDARARQCRNRNSQALMDAM